MFEKLPSLRGFQPKFYSGGPMRFHLPLLYDLVANVRPKLAVTLGWDDGQAFFTLCQAANEQGVDCRCVAAWREHSGDVEEDDVAWQKSKDYGEEFYGDRARFFSSSAAALAEVPDGTVDLLLLDDCDSGTEIRRDLSGWESKLAPKGIVLLHGAALERDDNPKAGCEDWLGARSGVFFPEGIGLLLAPKTELKSPSSFLLQELFGPPQKVADLREVYAMAAARIDAVGRAALAERASAAFEIRQVWLDSLLADRWKAQEIMDHQAREVADLERRLQLVTAEQEEQRKNFDILRRDRAKAQLVMDSQDEQLKHWVAEANRLLPQVETLKAQIKEQKRILNAAKNACRKKGRCFQIETGPKVRRPLTEKIARELRRLPRNLGFTQAVEEAPAPAKPQETVAASIPVDRYMAWIAEHEPDRAGLETQRRLARELRAAGKISLLTPVHNTPVNFLEEMFASVAAQTYDNWELCIVDGGSDRPETIETIRRWESRDKRIRVEHLSENLGISENTNRALQMATGDFWACLDHDDLLAPFALFELARAAAAFPEADIFYSDEDRLNAKGERHAPFFKPEWSPELLLNSMYIGHLTAYRRSLALGLGGFRREFDLSQDYDFALRATERAGSIHHIPRVLYHWREHPASGSTGGKPGARQANLAALADAMARRNLPADILEYPTANRARLKVAVWPRVSIIIPTDSPTRARACLQDLPRATKYPDLEIVLVTNSKLADSLKILEAENALIRLVPYDKLFNFSDKCNVGAAAATGERVIFFNDDVEAVETSWIQNLIEPLENPEVGAVAPKLLYADGKIQHAGLVTGVRGLVGTACHQWPADSADYTNFAQSMRDVSALSAACLAMRREDFFRVGEFDAINTPIAHSDLDLCFKVREAGMRCVYTPFVTMTHSGHASIGAVENEERKGPAEKVSVFLLKRWSSYATHDPYFPDNVRDWLYADSPTPIRMWSRNEPALPTGKPDLLFVSHDLTWSGAPLILLHTARWFKARGYFVTVVSPLDGPLRAAFVEAQVPVIVDPLIVTGHPSFTKFAREFDCVIASTIFSAPVVRAAKLNGIPHLWWIHEGRVAEHYIGSDPTLRAALSEADSIVTPDTRSSLLYQPFTDHKIRVLPYGIPEPPRDFDDAASRRDGRLRFLLLGTIEYRKGQKILLEALQLLPGKVLENALFSIVGRPHDIEIAEQIRKAAGRSPHLEYQEGVSPEVAHRLIQEADVIVSASWDETGPIILMEALALGKPILSTNVGAVGESLAEGSVGLFFKPGDAEAMAKAIEKMVSQPGLLERFAGNARASFEKHFDFDRFGRGFLDLVQEVIANRTAPSRRTSLL